MTTSDWKYVRRLYGAAMVVFGAFLLTEHIYRFGFEWWDIIGHEYLGLGLILGGVFLTMRWKREKEPGETF
jgi:hypothetical protein